MNFATLFGLIVCNAVWATNPAMGKLLMAEYSPFQTAWLRYTSAFSTVLLVGFFASLMGKGREIRNAYTKKNFPWILLMGFLTFFVSSYAQYEGLARSTATANSLIVATEPLFAVLLAWLFLRERVYLRQTFAFAFAIAGFALLSNLRPDQWKESIAIFNFGNIFLLVSMPAEAMYSIISRRLAKALTAPVIYSSALAVGLFCLSIFVFFVRREPFPHIATISRRGLLALLWLGPIGTCFTYIYWAHALKKAPVAFVSLTLFLQPIVGAILGTTLLGERLTLWQEFGGALILLALTLESFPHIRKARS